MGEASKACPVGGGGAPLFRRELPPDFLPSYIKLSSAGTMDGLKLFGSGFNSDCFADIYGTATEFIGDVIEQELSDLSEPAQSVSVEVV